MQCQCGIEIIDLEKDSVAVGFERTKIVFFIWIVGVAKVVVDFDCLDDARHCFGTERSDAYRHHRVTLVEILSQLVVERANAVGLGVISVVMVVSIVIVMPRRNRSRRRCRRRWMGRAMGWIWLG